MSLEEAAGSTIHSRIEHQVLAALVDHDATTTQGCSRIRAVCGIYHVVINDAIALILIPDLDPEFVHSVAAANLAVPGG